MPDQPLPRPFHKALAAFRGVEDPLSRLAAVHSAREALESLEQLTVAEARAAGATWVEIGMLYGVSKQAAQQRFRHPAESADGHRHTEGEVAAGGVTPASEGAAWKDPDKGKPRKRSRSQ